MHLNFMSADQNSLFIFPGQGAQYPGIGKDLFDAYDIVRQTYREASDTLGYDMERLSFTDPEGLINLTRYTQPVLLTHHVACLRIFNELSGGKIKPRFAAGHSLGEYSALLSAGVINFEQALTMVSARGEMMGKYGRGEMEALTLDVDTARELADEFYCGIAALNLSDQTVVGGLEGDLQALADAMKERFPRKRSTRLKTEGAFHTYYMVDAATRFRAVLEANEFKQPAFAVCSNYTGGFHDGSAASIRSRLFMQLFNPVLWLNNLNTAVDQGVKLIFEFGGGIGKGESAADKRPNLEGIVKKIFRGHPAPPQHFAIINLDTLQKTLNRIDDEMLN
jgi:[acyl-carrier-protein] S-malonyltransferase